MTTSNKTREWIIDRLEKHLARCQRLRVEICLQWCLCWVCLALFVAMAWALSPLGVWPQAVETWAWWLGLLVAPSLTLLCALAVLAFVWRVIGKVLRHMQSTLTHVKADPDWSPEPQENHDLTASMGIADFKESTHPKSKILRFGLGFGFLVFVGFSVASFAKPGALGWQAMGLFGLGIGYI